jgi:hypothetical protein
MVTIFEIFTACDPALRGYYFVRSGKKAASKSTEKCTLYKHFVYIACKKLESQHAVKTFCLYSLQKAGI